VPPADPPLGEMLIQAGVLTEAAHDPPLHPLGLAVMVNCVEPPVYATDCAVVGLTENVQMAAACVIWKVVVAGMSM
jgi:hypothetical protein